MRKVFLALLLVIIFLSVGCTARIQCPPPGPAACGCAKTWVPRHCNCRGVWIPGHWRLDVADRVGNTDFKTDYMCQEINKGR